MNIEIVSGSPRNESITYRLVLFLQEQLKQQTAHKVDIIDVREWNFPAMQQNVFTSEEVAPDKYKPLARRVFAANAFILVTPEYNGSYTTSLKNLFDHFPKQQHKGFGIVTASPGSLGGMRAALQLQLLICALFGVPSPYMLVTPHVDKKFDDQGQLTDPSFLKTVNTFLMEFLWLSQKLAV